MSEENWTALFVGVFVLLTLAHCAALFITGWGHIVADWWRDRFGRNG